MVLFEHTVGQARLAAGLTLLFAMAGNAGAIVMDPVYSSGEYASRYNHPVVELGNYYYNEQIGRLVWRSVGSGVIVQGPYAYGNQGSDPYILTAAHVIDSITNFADARGLRNDSSIAVRSGSSILSSWSYARHPNWNPGVATVENWKHDLAVVTLHSYGIQNVLTNNDLHRGGHAVLTRGGNSFGWQAGLNTFDIAGYGLVGNGRSDSVEQLGSIDLRAGRNSYSRRGGDGDLEYQSLVDAGYFVGFDLDATHALDAVSHEAMSAPGDSGGGLFVGPSGGRTLLGISSFEKDVDGNGYGRVNDESYYVNLSRHLDWINNKALDLLVERAAFYQRVVINPNWITQSLGPDTVFEVAVDRSTVLAGDLDNDGDVDDADFALAFAAFSGPRVQASTLSADLDNDRDVDDADFALAFAAYTGPAAATSVPEPTSLALLASCVGLMFAWARGGLRHRIYTLTPARPTATARS